MNPYGSYRALLGNSVSAMLAAIEIYNKPQFTYRSECFVILLLNSWELAFKAILSKNRVRIFKPKERDKPYMTLGLWDSIEEAKEHFPESIEFKPVSENIGRLVDYRNNAVHFYNEDGFEALIYGLAQTSIVNYRDVISACFDRDIASEVNISLLPLSFGTTPDPIQFLSSTDKKNQKPAISEFLKIISDTTAELENDGFDTGRFLTVFQVNLQSTKKVQSADIVAGIKGDSSNGVLLVSKKVDPNKSHPLNRKKVLEKIDSNHRGTPFNERTFDALAWKYGLKEKENLCWKNENMETFQYSPELVSHLKSYTKDQILEARKAYSDHQKAKRANKAG
jgi:hypothetical protein